MTKRALASLLAVVVCSACQNKAPETTEAAAPPSAAKVDAVRIIQADNDPANWLTHGRTYSEQRFSPLDRINAGTVKQLGLAWSLDLDTHRGQEATPLIIDGVMYSTSAWSKVQAIDAATGKLLWQYDPRVPGEFGVKACCDTVNRGVAAHKGRLYLGALDGRLIALDAATGKEVWSVVTVDQSQPYTITGAPRIVKDRVIIGNGGAELGVRGYVSAYDPADGKLLWRFYTVPGDPSKPFEGAHLEKAAKTWNGEWWKLGGGGTVWDSMAYDPDLDLLYIGVGNGSPWNQQYRSPGGGDNLYLSSIVAIKPETGEYAWHYQSTPGETWDFTATQHIILADIELEGQPRKVLMQAPKNGFFYVIDRTNGALLSAKPFVQVNWATEIDMKTGRPVETKEARFTDHKMPFIAMPGPYGAHNWHPMSYSPQTGLVYIPAQDVGFVYMHDSKYKPESMGFNIGIDKVAVRMPDDPQVKAAALSTVRGYLKAWDPVKQEARWTVEHPGAWNGGILSTAGNLVFQGNVGGEFVAYNAADGTKLWSFPAQTGIVAAPATYAIGDEQYVVVVAGWGGTYAISGGDASRKGGPAINRSRVLAFKLGATGQLPEPVAAAAPVQPPEASKDKKLIEHGIAVYHTHCSVCHGDSAVGGGVLPDLRWSAINRDAAAWKEVVINGARKDRGMVSFAPVLSEADADAARQYVIWKANQDFASAK
ncbi:alcohol dehydrogenase (cytochrome c)/quinohemoprotein ethanol dehydrogenase [Povalibacter uvarum]|uniref:Alcohol dehydrogenase (Cytochrome c)/quinohemoprotein ethanol dehydrogenase n=1 Tax=Povalibacter uvarum TaxID=732238 RepID=A0A841HHS1_9GAMM|nr:PQQ-dependent dehydrogenase, methanol/ethanol family [Povalibacter uvarum]MBB6091860.1 alcohol dehydrogenase (cytochrome c)/quinohemoprotein ethanol dehydrogenase [Povalibacter uvarum]